MSGPQPWLNRLATSVALRELVKVAGLAPTLTDAQLQARLLALAGWLR